MDIRVPQLAEGVAGATVAGVLVSEGDHVEKDQPLLELESEKAVGAVPAPQAGVVSKILVKAGDEVKVGQVVCSLDAGAAAPAGTAAPAAQAAAPAAPRPSAPAPAAQPATAAPAASAATAVASNAPMKAQPYQSPSGVPPPASPTVRYMARELGIDLTRVRGTENGGRITVEDLRNYVQFLQQGGAASAPVATAAAPAPAAAKPVTESIDFSKWGPVEKKPMSSLRKKISQKMSESWQSVAKVNQFDDADITTLMQLAKQHSPAYEKKGARLTVTVLVLKALTRTLEKHPLFNASVDEATQEIVMKQYIHLGIAVDTEAGLIVPVIRNADKKSFLELSLELQQLAEKTRQRKVGAEELQGGSFTVSNQGAIGSKHFTPIVNTPQVAILGMGRASWQPAVVGEEIQKRMILPLCLAYDHRLIDGGNAARFMVDFVKAIQEFPEADLKLGKE